MPSPAAPQPPDARPKRRGAARWLVVAGTTLGALAYGLYVAVGLIAGLSMLSAALERPPAAAAAEPPRPGIASADLIQPPIFPGLTLPQPEAPSPPVSPLALIPDWKGTERINVLLLGIDQRDDERRRGIPSRTDTMIVLSIDPVQKSATLISFPRDLWVAVPGLGEERINAAYQMGELRRLEGGGPGLTARTIEQNFGLRVPYYATVDFRGFEEIVNTLGGLIVDVPRPLRDDQYPTDNYGIERVIFLSGPQLMDGSTALKYARTRHSDSDFGRMARQQQVLLAARDRALRLNMIPRLPTLLDQGMRLAQTNFTPAELLSLGKLATEIEQAAVGTLVIDGQLVSSVSWPASILLPKRAEIQRAIRRAMADPRMLREGARIEIASTAARAQLAQSTLNRLASEGLQVTQRTLPPSAEPDVTQVTVYREKPRSLDATVRALALDPDLPQVADGESAVDISIVIGRDFQLPPATS